MDSKQLNWKNLKIMACPICTGKLVEAPMGYKCSHDVGYIPCMFRISYERFNQIVKDLYQPTPRMIATRSRLVPEEENREHLNNL